MSANKDSLERINRRKFLQNAALGIGTVSLTLFTPKVYQAQAYEYEYDVYGGLLVGKGDNWIEIQENDQTRKIFTDPNTFFWKGGETFINSLNIGDEIITRATLVSNTAIKVWSNITRYKGHVIKETKGGYILKIKTKNNSEELELLAAIDENTLFGDPEVDLIPEKKKISEHLKIDDFVDIIGETTTDGILATTIIHRPETKNPSSSKSKTKLQVAASSSIVGPNTIWVYTGHSNWYDCATGAGGCAGSCNISNSYQTAYPSTGTCRGSCAGSCCDCTSNCYSMAFKSCQNTVIVRDRCYTKSRTVTIVDCGPNVNNYCSQGCGYPNCSNLTPPIIDLTKPTFTYFRDPNAGWGCFSCDVEVSV